MITLTRKQLEKVNVLAALTNGLLTNRQAAQMLHLSVRTIQRKKKAYLTEKEQAIIHKNTGRCPSNRIPNEIRTQIAHLLTTDLQGYNFAHASEILQTESALSCSESTVRRVANEFRLSAPGKKRRSARHPSRKRRPCEGEMAQADASQYDWLSTGKNSYLHGYIDDATGNLSAFSL
ncbi:helix-turn-helix domain-containing protein [Peptoniphilaceae bacterium SGI.097]